MTTSGSAGSDGALSKRRARFNRWRRTRPFAGGALLILASFVIAWIPIHIAPETILLGRALSPVGLLFAALVFLCGMFALTRPDLADIFGIFGIVFSIFSLYGALGGLGLGLLLGLMGGNLCYAWETEDDGDSGGSGGSDSSDTTENDESDFDFGADSSEEDDSGGLFGSRSVRSDAGRTTAEGRPAESKTTGAGGRTASVAMLVLTVVVLGAFAQPFVVAADSFPEQTEVDGTIVVAEQFSGTSYNHLNVTSDTSNRARVSAARLAFGSANIQGMTIYKNFRTDSLGAFHLTITGSSASAPNGLSLTTSEAYFAKMGVGKDPVVIPVARKKWTTCPGQDFLLRVGDLGPAPDPPIEASGVVTNTHRMYAQSITIQNLTLTMQEGTKSTSVQGTPECTTNPVEPVLDLFTANALSLLTDNGVIPPNVTTNSTVSGLNASENVTQGETFNVSADITNTGFINDTKTVEFRFDNETRRVTNVTLAPDESRTVTFADIRTRNKSEGTYGYSVSTQNDSETGTITVVNESANATNTTANAATNGTAANATTNTTAANTTSTNETATNATTAPVATNETTANTTANGTTTPTTATAATETGGNETTTTADESPETVGEPTPTPTETPTETSTTGTNSTETTTTAPTETTTASETQTTAAGNTTNGTANESSLVGLP